MRSLLLILAAALPASAAPGLADAHGALSEAAAESRALHFHRTAPGFYRPPALPNPMPRMESVMAALVMLRGHSHTCSGTVISRSGHVLTAAHCVQSYLSGLADTRLYGGVLREHPRPAHAYDEATRWKISGGPYLRLVAAAWSGGTIMPRSIPPAEVEADSAVAQRLRLMLTTDWAIMKAETPVTTSCLAADEAGVAVGEPVWRAGYPDPAYRPGGAFSLGLGAYATYGNATHAEAGQRHLGPQDAPVARAMFATAVERREVIVSDADSMSGMSGGPIINARGLLAGSASRSNNGYFLFGGYNVGPSVKAIFAQLRASGLDPASYFDCPAQP